MVATTLNSWNSGSKSIRFRNPSPLSRVSDESSTKIQRPQLWFRTISRSLTVVFPDGDVWLDGLTGVTKLMSSPFGAFVIVLKSVSHKQSHTPSAQTPVKHKSAQTGPRCRPVPVVVSLRGSSVVVLLARDREDDARTETERHGWCDTLEDIQCCVTFLCMCEQNKRWCETGSKSIKSYSQWPLTFAVSSQIHFTCMTCQIWSDGF